VLETRAASPNAPPVVHELVDAPLTDYAPLIRVVNECFKVLRDERDPLSLFMYFLGGFKLLSVVCNATNERAEKHRAEDNSALNARP
jgi:hypothetical protein